MRHFRKLNIRFITAKLSVLLCVVLITQDLVANDQASSLTSDYSQGMRAYMAGDFERSQIHWLNAAKLNDAKSMFNLGLLHEQSKISDADREKAENWYRLAGEHGYAAADYHLANLLITGASELQDQSNVIQTLLQRAANNNFIPAQLKLAELNGEEFRPEAQLNSSEQNFTRSRVGDDLDEAKQKTYLTEDWIKAKQPSNWTIQILAFNDKNKVHTFIDRYDLNETASYFIDSSHNKVLYKLIYGSYQSKQEAELARDNLASELKVYGPWLRTIASVQATISVK